VDEIISITEIKTAARLNLGDLGEALAARFLQKEGYRLVVANFKVPVGRNRKGVASTWL